MGNQQSNDQQQDQLHGCGYDSRLNKGSNSNNHNQTNQNENEHNHKQHKYYKSKKQKSKSKQKKRQLKQNQIYYYGGIAKVDKQANTIVREIQVQSVEQESYLSNMLDRRMVLRHQNFSGLERYEFVQSTERQGHLCSARFKTLRLTFEPVIFTLHSLIKVYCQQRRPIQQHKIRKIFKQVASCLDYLELNNTYHGDIKPENIGIVNKQVKLVDSVLLQQGKTAFQIILDDPRAESFLTPQQLVKSKDGKFDYLRHVHRSQVFCLGMCMIQAMTFQSSLQGYDLEALQLKPQFFQSKFREMQEYGYSFELVDLALTCAHKNPLHRPDFRYILHVL